MIYIKSIASGSDGNCYLVSDGSSPLLLECGIRYKEIQLGLDYKVTKLAGCLITHEHQDHCKAVNDMIKAGVDCYMSKGTAIMLGLDGHRVRIVEPKVQFNISGWQVLPFETQHDAEEPLGFLLANEAGDKLLYATDTYYIKYKFSGLTHLMIECNYSLDILRNNVNSGLINRRLKNRILKSHFGLENVKNFLLANDLGNVQEIWLLHLSDTNSDAARFKREIQELTGKMVFVGG